MKNAGVFLVLALALLGCQSAALEENDIPPAVEVITQTKYVHESAPLLPVPETPPITSAVSDAEAAEDPEGYQRSLLADLESWVAVALEAIGIIEDSNATRPEPGDNNGG